MGAGEKAGWLALGSGAIVAVIAGLFTRMSGGLSRRTEVDKIYMGRVESLEKQLLDAKNTIDAKNAVIQELREQHIADLPASERERALQSRVVELIETNRELQTRLDGFMQRFIGGKEPTNEEG